MQIVIEIPEWKYKSICVEVETSKRCGVATMNPGIDKAIYEGTPLPKGHGRLIDADALEKKMRDREKELGYDRAIWESSVVSVVLDMLAPIIIPADTESEGEQ